MMTTSKAAAIKEGGKTATTILQPGQECCMCGDFGLPSEIFRCEVCQFRSQHRYCSNLYPKAEAYSLCNWCLLSRKDESGDKTQNSLNSSSSNKTNTSDQDDVKTTKKKNGNHGSLGKGAVKLHDIKNSIKKQRSPDRLLPPLLAARKRITTTTTTPTITAKSDPTGDKLRRTKSSNAISSGTGNGMIRKPVFRNKVRRYKLLDEVSSL